MEHVKHYKDIRVPSEQLIRKIISYANPTPDPKVIQIVSQSQFIRVKETQVQIKPYSSGDVRLRMYFDGTCGRYQQGDILIHDGDIT